MLKIKKILKLVVLVSLVALALFGVGFNGAGPVFSPTKERYMDNGVKTELVQVKDEDGESTELEVDKL